MIKKLSKACSRRRGIQQEKILHSLAHLLLIESMFLFQIQISKLFSLDTFLIWAQLTHTDRLFALIEEGLMKKSCHLNFALHCFYCWQRHITDRPL